GPGAGGEVPAGTGAAGGVALGVGAALALLAITAVQGLAPRPPDRPVRAARWAVILLALALAAGGVWLAPPAQAGLVARGLAGWAALEGRRRAAADGPGPAAEGAAAARRAPAAGAAGGAPAGAGATEEA